MYLEFVWQALESLVIAGLGAQNTRKILNRSLLHYYVNSPQDFQSSVKNL